MVEEGDVEPTLVEFGHNVEGEPGLSEAEVARSAVGEQADGAETRGRAQGCRRRWRSSTLTSGFATITSLSWLL
jgi:hypothetical protein